MEDILEVLWRVLSRDVLNEGNFRWCFVNEKKIPLKKDGEFAKPNNEKDFVEFSTLIEGVEDFTKFKGLGFSINYSNVCAIDIDKCVETPFDINTINDIGKEILEMFKDHYCEFSFSGTGLRIIFKYDMIYQNYSKWFYIKNSNNHIEFYHPIFPARYVTMTGKYIYDNKLTYVYNNLMLDFWNKYMKREEKEAKTSIEETNDMEEINRRLKKLLRTNSKFQSVFFSKAPGSGKNESELDYYLMSSLYENVTTNPLLIKELIERSEYYETKDRRHKSKWNDTNYVMKTIGRMG